MGKFGGKSVERGLEGRRHEKEDEEEIGRQNETVLRRRRYRGLKCCLLGSETYYIGARPAGKSGREIERRRKGLLESRPK